MRGLVRCCVETNVTPSALLTILGGLAGLGGGERRARAITGWGRTTPGEAGGVGGPTAGSWGCGGGVPLGGGRMLEMGGSPPQLVWAVGAEAALLVVGGVEVVPEGGSRGLGGGEELLFSASLSRRLIARVSSDSISGLRASTISCTRDLILTDLVWGEGSLRRHNPRRGESTGSTGTLGGDLGVGRRERTQGSWWVLPVAVLVVKPAHPGRSQELIKKKYILHSVTRKKQLEKNHNTHQAGKVLCNSHKGLIPREAPT